MQLPVVNVRVRIRMFTNCYRCGSPDHTRRNCPQAKKPPEAARATPAVQSWKPPPPPANRHAYPDDHWLWYQCPHCESPTMSQCVNVGTGRERRPHEARLSECAQAAR